MLEDLLDRARDWVPDAGRYLISPSRPAADCALLAVWQAGVVATAPSKTSCQVISKVELHLTMFSCTPTQDTKQRRPPSVDAITMATTRFVDQGYAIWTGLVSAATGGGLFTDERIGCGEIDLTQGQRAIDASGGQAGWDFAIFVTL